MLGVEGEGKGVPGEESLAVGGGDVEGGDLVSCDRSERMAWVGGCD